MKLAIIIGSARNPRRSEHVANYVFDYAKEKSGFEEVELLDVAEWDFKLDVPSNFEGNPDYSNEVTKAWSEKIAPVDAFIFITSENNHGYSASLKLAIDYLYNEWAHKPVGFVSLGGGAGGGRAIENILPVARAVSLVPIASDIRLFSYKGDLDEEGKVEIDISKFLDSQFRVLLAYAEGLKDVRGNLAKR